MMHQDHLDLHHFLLNPPQVQPPILTKDLAFMQIPNQNIQFMEQSKAKNGNFTTLNTSALPVQK
jgi:hypothetical protein